MSPIWREPAEDTYSYPGLWLSDDCVTGSINVKDSRLPLWAIVGELVQNGWKGVERGWEMKRYEPNFKQSDLAGFLYYLLEMRGEFGRLLMELADAERRQQAHDVTKDDRNWWEMPTVRTKLLKQLKRCVDALEAVEPKKPYSNWKRIGAGIASYDFSKDEPR